MRYANVFPARALGLALAVNLLFFTGCATGDPSGSRGRHEGTPAAGKIDARQAQQLQSIMRPLIENMDKPIPLNQVRIAVLQDDSVNAANAGGGDFYVTTGFLKRADEEHMRGVLAHEVAHADLGHVAKAKALGTGLNIGMFLLDQVLPGSGAVTPLVADFGVMRPFSRSEEYAADAHGVEILNRAGYKGKQVMADTLTWLLQTSGPSGGFLETHPGTQDRIQRVRNMG
jgi:predicted Zn-dependent protease